MMRILPNPVAFQWDPGNIDKNVTVLETEELFTNEPCLTFEDMEDIQAIRSRLAKKEEVTIESCMSLRTESE